MPDLTGTRRLAQRVGTSRALEICATGRRVDAAEAVRIGIALTAVPVIELGAAIGDLVAALTTPDPEAVRAVTRLFVGIDARSEQEQQAAERSEQVSRLRALARAFPAG